MHLGEYYLALEAFEKAMNVSGVSLTKETDLDAKCKCFLSFPPPLSLSEWE